MRKAFVVLLALLAAVIGCFGAFHSAVYATAEDVTVTRQTLYGDPAAAQGAKILVRNHYSHNLLWETSLTLGEDAEPETDFTFSNDTINLSGEMTYDGLEFSGFQTIWSFNNSPLSDATREKYADIIAYLTEAEASVKEGERKEFSVDLSDYLEYYPLEGQIILPGITIRFSEFENWTEDFTAVARKINDFFRIPVDSAFVVQFDIDKNGSSTSWGVSMKADYYIHDHGVAAADACYFTFNTVKDDGTVADTSLIPGGYGIYRLPYDEEKVDLDALKMVYALDPMEEYHSLALSADGQRLRLLTWQGSDLMLTVIDIATMTQVQKVKILTDTEDAYYNIYSYDDFLLIENNRRNADDLDRVFVWEELADGTYAQAIDAPINRSVFPEDANLNLFYQYENAVDYADGKLVVLHHVMRKPELYWYYSVCDIYVAVYDATGMVYAGTYQWNLTKLNDQERSNNRIQPMYNGSLEVSW